MHLGLQKMSRKASPLSQSQLCPRHLLQSGSLDSMIGCTYTASALMTSTIQQMCMPTPRHVRGAGQEAVQGDAGGAA